MKSKLSSKTKIKNITLILADYLSFIVKLKKLKKLYLSKNIISDASPISQLSDLETLLIGVNPLSDIHFVSKLKKLKVIRMGECKITDISPIKELTNLEVLRLGANQIDYFLREIANFPHLEFLKLHGNRIKNIPSEIYDFDGNCLEKVRKYFLSVIIPHSIYLTVATAKGESEEILIAQANSYTYGDRILSDGKYIVTTSKIILKGYVALNDNKNNKREFSIDIDLDSIGETDWISSDLQIGFQFNSENDADFIIRKGNGKLLFFPLEGLFKPIVNDDSNLESSNKNISLTSQLIQENLRTQNPFLDLRKCGLNGDEPELELLKECKHLKELYLGITIIHRNIPHTNNELDNQIIIFDFLTFIPSLEVLDIGENRLEKIPNEISSLTNLTHLYCSYGRVAELDFSLFESLKKLSFIRLTRNKIKLIKGEVALPQITWLDLKDNQISDISANLINIFPKLTYLNLQGNPIQNLPKEVFDFEGNCLENVKAYFAQDITYAKFLIREAKEKGLKILDLGNLGLTSLEELPELFELKDLEVLQLGSFFYDWQKNAFVKTQNNGKPNIIKRMPVKLNDLLHLKKLYFRNIGLEDVMFLDRFKNKRLKVLDLGGNPLSSFAHLIAVIFNNVKSKLVIEELSLGAADIRFLLKHDFADTIKYLDLSEVKGVKTKDLEKIVSIFTNLEKINLMNNDIKNIDYLKNLQKLVSLDLRNNAITNFPFDFLDHLPLLQELYLQGNPIGNITIAEFEDVALKEIKINYFKPVKKYFDDLNRTNLLNKFHVDCDELTSRKSEFVFLVGLKNSGKTSFLKTIFEGSKDEYYFETIDVQSNFFESQPQLNEHFTLKNETELTEVSCTLHHKTQNPKGKKFTFLDAQGNFTDLSKTKRDMSLFNNYLNCSAISKTFILCLPASKLERTAIDNLVKYIKIINELNNKNKNCSVLLLLTKWDTIYYDITPMDWLKGKSEQLSLLIQRMDKSKIKTGILTYSAISDDENHSNYKDAVLAWLLSKKQGNIF